MRRLAGSIGCLIGYGVVLGYAVSQETNEVNGKRRPWLATTPVEVLERASKAEKVIQDRVKWTDELRERRRLFVERARLFDSFAWEKIEGFLTWSNRPPEEYVPSGGVLETKVYLVGLLLRDGNANVRHGALMYLLRAFVLVRDNTQCPRGATREEQLAGKYQLLWFEDVMIPLIRRNMFDKEYLVSGNASDLRRLIRPGGIEEIVQVVSEQGTNEWVMNFWRRFVAEGRTNVVPVELLPEVRRRIETDERTRTETVRKMKELARRSADAMAEYDA